MHVGDDRRQAEFPLEAQRQIENDPDGGDQQRERAILRELLADLRAHELDPAYLGRAVLALQQGIDLLREFGARLPLLDRHADKHIARRSEILDLGLEPRALERGADLLHVRTIPVVDLHQRAAGELDREVQPACGEEENGRDESDQRNDVEDERIPHERYGSTDLEKLHLTVLPAR
jgi:hypothetical protein